MEPVFGVTSTSTIVDSDTCKLANGTGMSITPVPEDDDISNCTYIINLPPSLSNSHNGGGDDHFETGDGGKGGDGSELTVELMKHVSDVVTFTELTDLDNGVVTKVDRNNDANAMGISGQEGGEQGSDSGAGGGGNEEIIPPKVIHHPTAIDLHVVGQQGEFSIGLNGGGEICASSNLLKLIHQGHPDTQVERMEGIVQGDVNVGGAGESATSITVAAAAGKGTQKKIETPGKAIDHCNNESTPKLLRSPMRTYSRKNKGSAQPPAAPAPEPAAEPATTSTMSTENSNITITSPIESKVMAPPPPVDVKVFPLPPQPSSATNSSRRPVPTIRVMESKRVSIPIPERKRKLVVDSHKQINNSEFKKQLIQTGDILHERQADLGPSTRQAMKCLEFGGVAQFFVSPGRAIGSSPLSKLYYNQLVMDVEPSSRKQKGASKSPKLVPLNSNDLKLSSGDHHDDGSNDSTGTTPKQRIHVGQLNATSLEAEFKSYKFTKPFVFKEYASVRWKSNRSLGQTYSKLKRSQELRRNGQGPTIATTTSVNTTDQNGSEQQAEQEEVTPSLIVSIDGTPSEKPTAQLDDGSDDIKEETMPVPTGGEDEALTVTCDGGDVDYIDIEPEPEVKIKDEEIEAEFILPGGPSPRPGYVLYDPQPSTVPVVEPVDDTTTTTSEPPGPGDQTEIKSEITYI